MLHIQRITVSLTVVIGIALLLFNAEAAAVEASTDSETGELALTIQDADGDAIEGCRVKIFQWTGEHTPTGIEGNTDAEGRIHLLGLPVDEYLFVDINADGFVSKKLSMTFAKASQQELTVKLYRPVESWLEIRTADGKPLAGAELQFLRYTDADGATFFIEQKLASQDELKLTPSDEQGRLQLPPMPADVKLTASVIHAESKPSMISEIRSASGLVSSMTLFPGVPVDIVLKPADSKHPIPDGTPVDVFMMPTLGGSTSASTIRHRFQVKNGRISFAADTAEYGSLAIEADRFFIGPLIYNFPNAKFERLDLQDRSESVIEMTSHAKQLVRGRVVDHRGNGIAGADVRGLLIDQARMRQIEGNADNDESNANIQLASAATPAGGATTDANGYYEIELSPGYALVEAAQSGYFSQEEKHEFTVAADSKSELDDIVLLPVPVVRGVVENEAGKPANGMIVMLRSRGHGDALPVTLSDSQGHYELSMTRIPYAENKIGLEPIAEVVAFDPNANSAGRTEINLLELDSQSQTVVNLSHESTDWLLAPEETGTPNEDKSNDETATQLAEKFRAGLPGQTAPLMKAGTWLNTDANSLSDFRGKFVLLDFWFIGCGPCMRDLPQIQVAVNGFDKNKFAAISVHNNSMRPDVVDAFVKENGMSQVIVVDNPEGEILGDYKPLGVYFYPMYILIDPEGKIVSNDAVAPQNALRLKKLELIHDAILSWDWETDEKTSAAAR